MTSIAEVNDNIFWNRKGGLQAACDIPYIRGNGRTVKTKDDGFVIFGFFND